MIIYFTKETVKQFRIPMPEELSGEKAFLTNAAIDMESANEMLQWGCKILYFEQMKSLQFVHFASKMTIFMVDVEDSKMREVPDLLIRYLLYLYRDNDKVTGKIKRLCKEHPVAVFDSLKNRSIISTLNHTQSGWALDGYRFYDYVENNILQTKKMNEELNREWIFSKKNGNKTEYFSSYDKFIQVIDNFYKDEYKERQFL